MCAVCFTKRSPTVSQGGYKEEIDLIISTSHNNPLKFVLRCKVDMVKLMDIEVLQGRVAQPLQLHGTA